MHSPFREQTCSHGPAAADNLLLTLEVEAAAARNAELSRTVEELQEEVQRLRKKLLNTSLFSQSPQPASSSKHSIQVQHTPSPLPQRWPHTVDEPREVFLALDDLLFEMADVRSHLLSTTYVDLTPRTFDPDTTVTARALRCVAEMKKLKEALRVAQQSSAAQVAELRRALGEQVAAQERQQSHFAVQRATLERRCDELQQQYEAVLATRGEKVLNRLIQSPGVRTERTPRRTDDVEVDDKP